MRVVYVVAVFIPLLSGPGTVAQKTKNKPPIITKFESSATTISTCGASMFCNPKARRTVGLLVRASDPENESLTYRYFVSGGEIIGEGSSVSWKLGDQPLGTYSVTVAVSDPVGAEVRSTVKVNVESCSSCFRPDLPCPQITVEASSEFTDPKETYRGEIMNFHATVLTDAYFQTRPDYVWTVSGGKILKGQHTPWIEVEASGQPGTSVSAEVEVDGFDASCSKKASQSVLIKE